MFSIPYRIRSHFPQRTAAALFCLILAACGQGGLPAPDSEEYQETVTAFYTGIAALQVGQDRHAEEQLLRATELAPDEAAAWANLGLLALRRSELDLAAERLNRARTLAPEQSRVFFLSGLLEVARGNSDQAISYFQTARELDAENVKAIYALSEQIEQRGDPEASEEVNQLLEAILQIQPNNLAVVVERARRAAAEENTETLRQLLDQLQERASTWSEESRAQLAEVMSVVEAGNFDAVVTQLTFLSNVLKRETDYRESLASVRTEPGQPTDLIPHFISLESPSPHPAPPDDSLTFVVEPLFQEERNWNWARAVPLSAEGLPVLVTAGNGRLLFEDGTSLQVPESLRANGLIITDFNYDFAVDLGVASREGFRLYRQSEDSLFTDVTGTLGVPSSLLLEPFTGGWSVDVDMEGDLDFILARGEGPPLVLRNRGDGTFEERDAFDETLNVLDFAWADLDADGDPDAAFVTSDGAVHLYENHRSQGFEHLVAQGGGNAAAVTITDLDANGMFELVVLNANGAIQSLQQQLGEEEEQRADLARWDNPPSGDRLRIFAVDIDNNGGIDLVASGGGSTSVWLGHGDGTFRRLAAPTDLTAYSVADVTGGGRLDLIGVSEEQGPVRFANRGSVNYHSKSIRPQAATATGDQRINPFGLGGEIEVRSALLYQKQPISDPIVHFGLGEQLVVDVARIVWPNGDIQAEFDLLSDETVQARQRLKGSCPWLFTYDGEGMTFVTDFIWRSPLGLRINAQETAGVMTTEDWVKIDGSELQPRNGYYDLRITAELWETHFFDHVSLMAVDHPADTEVWVDERFAFPPPDLKVFTMGKQTPVQKVLDDERRDVTDAVLEKDGRYLKSFNLGSYQGVAEEHSIIVELSDAPASGPLFLLADGWVRPTDSSINVAISQGSHQPPTGLRLDVPDGEGGWRTAYPNLGFPAGKHKTILIDLTDVFGESDERQVRLTTNLEIYWDALSWAVGRPDVDIQTTRVDPSSADLRYRGYSVVREPDRTHPEVPVYDSLMSTTQIWQDLAGYYTRFGDVRELLKSIDDRYVIMNAGDELAFRFEELAPPPDGWERDYVLIGDGWVKDGDYNTTYSETVRPLPAHDLPNYSRARVPLEEDVVYRRHPEDWKAFHTRYVAPREFTSQLRFAEGL